MTAREQEFSRIKCIRAVVFTDVDAGSVCTCSTTFNKIRTLSLIILPFDFSSICPPCSEGETTVPFYWFLIAWRTRISQDNYARLKVKTGKATQERVLGVKVCVLVCLSWRQARIQTINGDRFPKQRAPRNPEPYPPTGNVLDLNSPKVPDFWSESFRLKKIWPISLNGKQNLTSAHISSSLSTISRKTFLQCHLCCVTNRKKHTPTGRLEKGKSTTQEESTHMNSWQPPRCYVALLFRAFPKVALCRAVGGGDRYGSVPVHWRHENFNCEEISRTWGKNRKSALNSQFSSPTQHQSMVWLELQYSVTERGTEKGW